MELRVLAYFLAVAREENFTRAAEQLHVTQPTLSRQIADLEQELGVKLFVRSSHHVVLTQDGMILKRRAQEILSLADKTKRDFLRGDETVEGVISIGSGEFLSTRLLTDGMAPEAIKELVYQAVAYLGYGRVLPFLNGTNELFSEKGIGLPLPGQAATTLENRLEKGAKVQAEIFGAPMKEAWKNGHINRWLAANCFGDYYTRRGLSLAEREMITFCFLMAQGGCEPQLIAHVRGNRQLGNDRAFLIRVVSQCLPYIGYPRSLNALACIDRASSE